MSSNGVVAIRGQEVTEYDVQAVINAAKTVAIPADQQLLHVMPYEYIVDHQPGVHCLWVFVVCD